MKVFTCSSDTKGREEMSGKQSKHYMYYADYVDYILYTSVDDARNIIIACCCYCNQGCKRVKRTNLVQSACIAGPSL